MAPALARRIITIVLVLALIIIVDASAQDYYTLLGVTRDATQQQIKEAFKKLVKQKHPDKNQSPDAQEEFQKLKQAFDTLHDNERRKHYNQFGEDGPGQGQGQGQWRQSSQVFDIFDQFRGFGGMGNVRFEREEKRAADLQLELVITLEEVLSGTTKHAQMRVNEICPHCTGSGADSPSDIHTCHQCHGHGRVMTRHGMVTSCNVCGGKGKIVRSECHVCKGHKVTPYSREFEVDVPKGITENEILVYNHEGDEHPDMKSGHISFKVSTAAHPVFTRNGFNLKATLEISLLESLVGFDKTINGLDGNHIKVSRNTITKPGEVLTVKNVGLPKNQGSSKLGDLFVECRVRFPTSLTPEQATVIDKVLPK